MSEKRFILSVNEDAPNTLDIIDIIADKNYNFVNDVVSMNQAKQLVDLLNEQQATITKLKERLYDFEKRKIIEESEIDEDVIPKVKLLRTELFGEKYEG